MLVLGATVLGARLAAAGDDRVEYWAVGPGATPGDTVSRDDLLVSASRPTREPDVSRCAQTRSSSGASNVSSVRM